MSNLTQNESQENELYCDLIQRKNDIESELDALKERTGIKALELLEQAATVALERRWGAGREAHRLYDQAMALPFPCNCTLIANAVFAQIVYALNFETSEIFLHSVFKSYHQKLIIGSELVEVRANPSHIPDFWVATNNMVCPVEIKDHSFDDAALRQLQRYMKFYKSRQGYAVAPSSKVKLPSNITFVELSIDVMNSLHSA